MATVNLHPNGIVTGNQQWTIQGGGTAEGNLADSDDTTGVRQAAQSRYCVVELDDYTSGGTVDSIRWYVRGSYVNTRSGDTDLQVVLGTGSHAPITGSADAYYSETFTLTFNAGYAPQDYYGTARANDGSSAWDATSLDALRLDINTSPEAPDIPGGPEQQARIWKAYVEVTYTEAVAADNATFFGANF
tara:strand:+ start:108 stop:674 length:567 start_codon:yes stop_codon:yes gene_type:complete